MQNNVADHMNESPRRRVSPRLPCPKCRRLCAIEARICTCGHWLIEPVATAGDLVSPLLHVEKRETQAVLSAPITTAPAVEIVFSSPAAKPEAPRENEIVLSSTRPDAVREEVLVHDPEAEEPPARGRAKYVVIATSLVLAASVLGYSALVGYSPLRVEDPAAQSDLSAQVPAVTEPDAEAQATSVNDQTASDQAENILPDSSGHQRFRRNQSPRAANPAVEVQSRGGAPLATNFNNSSPVNAGVSPTDQGGAVRRRGRIRQKRPETAKPAPEKKKVTVDDLINDN